MEMILYLPLSFAVFPYIPNHSSSWCRTSSLHSPSPSKYGGVLFSCSNVITRDTNYNPVVCIIISKMFGKMDEVLVFLLDKLLRFFKIILFE